MGKNLSLQEFNICCMHPIMQNILKFWFSGYFDLYDIVITLSQYNFMVTG